MYDPMTLAALAALLVVVGGFAGILAGLLGVGGGIVVVPVLFNVLGFFGIPDAVKMHMAVGTSLATIIPTAITSARAHFKRGSVDADMLRSWGPWIFAGVLIGTALAAPAKGAVLTGVFGCVALLVSAHMTFYKEGFHIRDTVPTGVGKALTAMVIGGFSAIMGIGGGTLSVPILSACNYPIRRAVGTASAIGLIIGIPGTIGFILAGIGAEGRPPYSFGYASLIGFVLLAPLQMYMAPYGAKLAHTISPTLLRKCFAVFLALTAARMLYSTFG